MSNDQLPPVDSRKRLPTVALDARRYSQLVVPVAGRQGGKRAVGERVKARAQAEGLTGPEVYAAWLDEIDTYLSRGDDR